MLALLKKIDHWLLPRGLTEPYSPYVWLIYLPLFFAPVIVFHHSLWQLLAVGAISVLFLLLYFHSYWVCTQARLWHIIGIIGLGVVAAFITPSACTLFIYASASCHALKTVKQAYQALAGIVFTVVLISWLFNYEAYFYLPAVVFSLLTGITTIYQYALNEKKQELILSQKETQRLAKVAERERIARDLHDLIGHTFSVITLKADLAGRLLDKGAEKDLEKARQEIKQLETISREALSQVREVVSGYRSSDLLSELVNAKNVFASLNIAFDYQLVGVTETELEYELATNKELAIVLRELVTNIIKHAKATQVSVTLKKQAKGIVLLVQDDGQGMPTEQNAVMGFGLVGIHERIEKLKGWVKIAKPESVNGTRSEIYVPLKTISAS
jgi:two-component system, NarL family, sensor histidine kinase DesK